MNLIGHQGDAVFFQVKEFPKDLIEDLQTKSGVIAEGVLSGHAHQFESLSDVELFKCPKTSLIYCNVKVETLVLHGRSKTFAGKESDTDYHDPIKLSPGLYAVGIVAETDWITKVVRKVVD